MELFCFKIVDLLGFLSPFFLTVLEFALCSAVLFLCLKYFGKQGIFAFSICALLLANIQLLRTTIYFFQSSPVALGNVAFSSIFLANNLLVEFFDINDAKKNIYLSFILHLFFAMMMLITLSYHPKTEDLYPALEGIFINSPRFFLAGAVSYLVSQFFDIHFFRFLKSLLYFKNLIWLRSILAVGISAILDNILFSVLAWKLFASDPVDNQSLIFTYVIGTYWPRLFLTFLNGLAILIMKNFYQKDYK